MLVLLFSVCRFMQFPKPDDMEATAFHSDYLRCICLLQCIAAAWCLLLNEAAFHIHQGIQRFRKLRLPGSSRVFENILRLFFRYQISKSKIIIGLKQRPLSDREPGICILSGHQEACVLDEVDSIQRKQMRIAAMGKLDLGRGDEFQKRPCQVEI
jgi:hypothetical protein